MSEWWFRFEINKKKFSEPFSFLVEELENAWNRFQRLSVNQSVPLSSSDLGPGILGNLALSNVFLLDSDVGLALAGKETKRAKKEDLALRNIIHGYEWIDANPLASPSLNLYWCENLNRIIGSDSHDSISYRGSDYWFGLYQAPSYLECGSLVKRLGEFINCDWTGLGFPYATETIIKAIVAHTFLFLIRPFEQGNGRTARLMEYAILKYAGFGKSLSHHGAVFHALHRMNYFRGIVAVNKSPDNFYKFIEYSYFGFLQGLLNQLAALEAKPKSYLGNAASK